MSISLTSGDRYHSPSDNKITIEVASAPLELTEAVTEKISCGSLRSRTVQNLGRVAVAGAFSLAGGLVAGLVPKVVNIVAGSALAGIGNGLSTWLAWKRKKAPLFEERIVTDFPLLKEQVGVLETKVTQIWKAAFPEEPIPTETKTPFKLASPIPENLPWYWRTRHRRNFWRLFIAGSLSGAGGCIAGLDPTVAKIILGSIVGGGANAISTWLAYEQKYELLIKSRASVDLPKIMEAIKEAEEKLLACIEKIVKFQSDFKLNEDIQPKSSLEDDTRGQSRCLKTRAQRNAFSVNLAGFLSSAGTLWSGFDPSVIGVCAGSSVSAAANAISTGFAWENENDEEIERTIVDEFPKLAQRIGLVFHQIFLLEKRLKQTSFISSQEPTASLAFAEEKSL